jgi:hypothetical protein
VFCEWLSLVCLLAAEAVLLLLLLLLCVSQCLAKKGSALTP